MLYVSVFQIILMKTGNKDAVLGLSGGIDSALTAAIAVNAIGSRKCTWSTNAIKIF